MTNYTYAVFDPRPQGVETNNAIFASTPAGVLGIEVTIPALAARCTLGNIDPQHTDGNASLAAIEVALTAELPPDGATLATVRADMDAFGAMALMTIHAEHVGEDQDVAVVEGTELPSWMTDGLLQRVKLVAESDRFDRGGWPGVQPLPTRENLWPEGEVRYLAAIGAAVMDFKVPVAERVAWMRHWLETGEEPNGYRARVEKEREDTLAALESGATKTAVHADGRIASVVSSYRAAISIGYRMAPVVVALNPAFSFQGSPAIAKFTICQFTAGYVDLKAAAELAALETGWGGSPTIIGSPQGVGSTLTLEQVLEIVARHLVTA
jgi:hypothetical protein